MRPLLFGDNVPLQILFLLALVVVMAFTPKLVGRLIQSFQQHRPRRCPECGQKMARLGEVQEKQYLDTAQQLEEQLAVSDYGVWTCTFDGHLSIERFAQPGAGYAACRACRNHTMETRRVVNTPASEHWPGHVTLHERCLHCDYVASRDVEIPALANPRP